MDEKLLEQARFAKSAEELLTLAKENDVELSAEEAQAYFDQLHSSGELADDELDSVAGGGCYGKDGRLVVTNKYTCAHYRCPECGKTTQHWHTISPQYSYPYSVKITPTCHYCAYCVYEKGLFLCTHEANRR